MIANVLDIVLFYGLLRGLLLKREIAVLGIMSSLLKLGKIMIWFLFVFIYVTKLFEIEFFLFCLFEEQNTAFNNSGLD